MDATNGESLRIVLADDDPSQRHILTQVLQQLGHRVECAASNGAELVAYCQQMPADVALLDFDMPLLDGLEAAEELSRRGIPVVLISGLPDADHIVLNVEPIAVKLAKPVRSQDLQAAIQKAHATKARHP